VLVQAAAGIRAALDRNDDATTRNSGMHGEGPGALEATRRRAEYDASGHVEVISFTAGEKKDAMLAGLVVETGRALKDDCVRMSDQFSSVEG
jgi:hypothetical protein